MKYLSILTCFGGVPIQVQCSKLGSFTILLNENKYKYFLLPVNWFLKVQKKNIEIIAILESYTKFCKK